MIQLVEFFLEIDTAVDKVERAQNTAERWQLEELSERLGQLIPLVDTMPLPSSARRAGSNVGDFFYLLKELADNTLEQADTEGESPLPTVREARKYDENPYEASLELDSNELGQVYLFREKARETLRRPANTYGLSVDRIFMPHLQDDAEEARDGVASDSDMGEASGGKQS